MMVLPEKVHDALERARKADRERNQDGQSARAENRAKEAFAAAAEVLFYLMDNDQTDA